MNVRIEEEITKCGVVIGLSFACGKVKEKVYKEIISNATDVASKMGFGPMLAYILYEAGENRIPKHVASNVVKHLLDFKDRTGESSIEVVLEIFKVANMTYKLAIKRKYACKQKIDNIEEFLRLLR